jgi:hypothetical protein
VFTNAYSRLAGSIAASEPSTPSNQQPDHHLSFPISLGGISVSQGLVSSWYDASKKANGIYRETGFDALGAG